MDLMNSLERVYGSGASAQLDRYTTALEAFARIYGPGPVSIFRSPGRVNLIGEHTDYNHGFVLPVAIDRDIVMLTRHRDDAVVQLQNVESTFEPRSFTAGRDIPIATSGDWSNYVRGAAQMVAHNIADDIHGMDALVTAADGLGTSPLAVALAWIRDRPGIASMIVGARDIGQLTGVLAAETLELPRAIAAALDDVSARAE